MRPTSSGSGIGGMFGGQSQSNFDGRENDEMGSTLQANANSPIKQERGKLRKWINDTGMQNASDFHPKNEEVINSSNF